MRMLMSPQGFVRLLIKPQRTRNHGSLFSFNGRTSPATTSETPIRASRDFGRTKEMAAESKQIVALAMHAWKPLGLTVRTKAAHLPFLLSSRLMGYFHAVVGVLILAVGDGRYQLTFGRRVTAKFVGRNFNRHLGLRTQHLTKEALGSLSILALLYKNLNKITVLVYSSPQITTLTLDRYDDFVEEPTIAARPQAFLDLPGVVGPECVAPLADGLIRDCDAAFGQEVFDIAEAQCEPMVEPHRSRDDFGRESISAIVRILSHA